MYTKDFTENTTKVNPFESDELLKQLVQASEVPSEDTALFSRRLTIADFQQPPPPRKWIVEKLFAEGSLSLVIGEAGSKKTWAMLDMAVSVAMGTPWLGFATTQSPVLIVDEESGSHRLRERMHKILNGHFATNANLPIIAFPSNAADFGNPEWVNALQLEIEQANAGLVVIDALSDVMPGRDENSVKDVQPVLLALRRVAESTGAAIVAIHHANKNGGYRGTSAIKGEADLMLMVESKPGSRNIDFKSDKTRDIDPVHFAAVITFSPTEQVWLSASEVLTNKEEFNKADRYVLRYLAEHGASLKTDIESNADSCSPNSARDALYRLADLGYAARVDGGGRRAQAIYDLTPKGKEVASKL